MCGVLGAEGTLIDVQGTTTRGRQMVFEPKLVCASVSGETMCGSASVFSETVCDVSSRLLTLVGDDDAEGVGSLLAVTVIAGAVKVCEYRCHTFARC